MEYSQESYQEMLKKYPTREQRDAYRKGLKDGKYGFSYINPYWNKEEINAWVDGYMGGIQQ